MTNELFDVTIIGGGPAGLFSCFYSGLREMKTKIIESQHELGGKVHVYPEKLIWDIGGLTPISGSQLIEQMVEQALTFEPTVILNEKATHVSKNENGAFVIETDTGEKHFSKSVIVAIGGGIINQQKLEIEGSETFELTNLNYTIKELKKFKDKVILISGGSHTAVDWANELIPIAEKVYVTYRKGEFKAHEAQVSQLLNSSAECLFYTEISKFISNDAYEVIEQVELLNNETKEKSIIKVDEVVVNHGYIREKKLLEESPLKIEVTEDYYIKGTSMCETSEAGLYAAGDIINYDGKVHLIAGAFQDAIHAVNKAKLYIEPAAEEKGIISSHNDVFQSRNRELIDSQL